MPKRLRAGAEGADGVIVDATQPDLLTLLERRRGTESRLGQIRLDGTAPAAALRRALAGRAGRESRLRLAGGAVLERAVTLPLAAERDLERVLGYEMERLTPFTADEVFWGFATEERDRVRARIALRLTIVPRAAVQGLIDLLASAGLRPAIIEAQVAGGVRVIRSSHTAQSGSIRLSTRIALTGAVLLLLAVIATPFLRQTLALSSARSRLHDMEPRITQVDALRRRIRGAGAGGDAVANETRRLGDALEALAAVTEILPDDSYLTEFTMRERKLTLSGLSASAPRLIALLSGDPRIRNPAFTAPVTRAETGRNDVFTIRAEAAP